MADIEKTKERAAREIVGTMGYKALFDYTPEMEISVPDSDKRNSLDKMQDKESEKEDETNPNITEQESSSGVTSVITELQPADHDDSSADKLEGVSIQNQ